MLGLCLNLFLVLAFNHNSYQRLCTGRTDEYSALSRKFILQFFDCLRNFRIFQIMLFFVISDLGIYQCLRQFFHNSGKFGKRPAGFHHNLQKMQSTQKTVAGGIFI